MTKAESILIKDGLAYQSPFCAFRTITLGEITEAKICIGDFVTIRDRFKPFHRLELITRHGSRKAPIIINS